VLAGVSFGAATPSLPLMATVVGADVGDELALIVELEDAAALEAAMLDATAAASIEEEATVVLEADGVVEADDESLGLMTSTLSAPADVDDGEAPSIVDEALEALAVRVPEDNVDDTGSSVALVTSAAERDWLEADSDAVFVTVTVAVVVIVPFEAGS
jgi:hypothetical protein